MVDLLGAGLTSLEELPDSLCQGHALNLHMNCLRSTKGLQRCTALEELILSSNAITELRGLEHLDRLRILDLSGNELRRLSGLTGLVALQDLRVAYNRLESLEGLQQLWGRRYSLRSLDLRCNRIGLLPQLLFLGGCTKLQDVRLKQPAARGQEPPPAPNPICAEGNYRAAVLLAVPWLCSLDEEPVSPRELEQASGSATAYMVEAALQPVQDASLLLQQVPVTREGIGDGGALASSAATMGGVGSGTASSAAAVSTAGGSAGTEGAVDGKQNAELLELAQRMAGMARELAHFRVPTGLPERVRRLQTEVLDELAALRGAEDQAAGLAKESRAGELREAGLRTDLAEIALHARQLDERHSATEHEFEQATGAVLAAGAARAREAELLEGEVRRQAELEAWQIQEAGLEAAACSAELSAQDALQRAEATRDAGVGAAADTAQLRRELQRTRAALEGGLCRKKSQEEALAKLMDRLEETEARVTTQKAGLEELQPHRRGCEAEVKAWGREAAAETTQLAAVVGQAALQEQHQQAVLALEAASALQSQETLEQLRMEAAACEQEASAWVSHRQLREVVCKVNDEHALSESRFGQCEQRCLALRHRLQVALAGAEETVSQGRKHLCVVEQRLAQQQTASRMADEQDTLARYILAELSLELEQSKASECEGFWEAEELHERFAAEKQTAARHQGTLDSAQRGTASVQRSIAEDHLPLVAHEQCLGECRGLKDAVSALREARRNGLEALEASTSQLGERQNELAELEEAFASARRQELEVEQNIRLKGHMATDKRDHMETVRLSMRRAEASQKEAHCALHNRLSEAATLTDEHQECARQLGLLTEEAREECAGWEAAVLRKGEMVRFTEEQLAQLRGAQAGREERAEARVRFLRDEERQLMQEARSHVVEMERRFREERRSQDQARVALGAEQATLRQRLQEQPKALLASRRHIMQERASSIEQVAALLAGLRG